MFLLIRMALSLECKVAGGSPRREAAPGGPDIRPLASAKAAWINTRSSSLVLRRSNQEVWHPCQEVQDPSLEGHFLIRVPGIPGRKNIFNPITRWVYSRKKRLLFQKPGFSISALK